MKKILSIISASFLLFSATAKAEMTYGIGLMAGQVSTSGTETEGSAADTSNRSKSIDEFFAGADVFIENETANGYTFGVSYVPLDVEIGSGQRTDSGISSGTRKASAELSNLITLYGNYPIGSDGAYTVAGIHYTTVKTIETLPNTTYGDENIFGAMIGFGKKSGNSKFELFYSDFQDISLSGNGGNGNKVDADADAITFRYSYGF